MFQFSTVQKMCEISEVKFGGQRREYATVLVPSIFQKGDAVFERVKRKERFKRSS